MSIHLYVRNVVNQSTIIGVFAHIAVKLLDVDAV